MHTAQQQAATDLEESEIVLQAENEPSDVLPKRKSENAKLLDDTLKHLSSENSPPDEPDSGPKVAQAAAGYAGAKQKFEKFGPTVKSHRPVSSENKVELQSENLSEAKHAFVKLRPTTSGKVGALASSFTKANEPSEAVEAKRPSFANLKPTTPVKFGAVPNASKSSTPSQSTPAKEALAKLKPTATTGSPGAAPSTNTAAAIHAAAAAKKIPTTASANKSDTPLESNNAAKEALAKLKTRAPPSPASAAPTSKPGEREAAESNGEQEEEEEEDSSAKNKFVQLKKVDRNTGPAQAKETELSKIQLKKSTRSTPPVSS